MQCIILAGGIGTRMKGVSGSTPKALLSVGPYTFIEWQLQWLKIHSVDEVILLLGYRGEEIRTCIKNSSAKLAFPKASFCFDGEQPLGTGGAIRSAIERFPNLFADDFLVTYGDSFLFADCAKLYQTHLSSKKPVTFSIFENNGLGDTSNVIYKDGKILKYDKTERSPEMRYIDYGIFALNKSYFLEHTPAGTFDIAGFLTKSCVSGQMAPFLVGIEFQETGSPEGYSKFVRLMETANFNLPQLAKMKYGKS